MPVRPSPGADVVVNARSNQQEAEAVAREARDLGVKAVPVLADVGKKAEVERRLPGSSVSCSAWNVAW
jgi:hypothetical protein